MKFSKLLAASAVILSGMTLAAGSVYSMRVSLNHKNGFYRSGENAVCSALLLKNGKPAVGEKIRCTIKRERVSYETMDAVCNGKPLKFKASMDRPGWMMFSFSVIGKDGKELSGPKVFRHRRKPTVVGEIGTIYDRDLIRAYPSRPADFKEFWAKERAKLDKTPLDPVIKEVKAVSNTADKVKCYAIEIKSSGMHPVTGYMAVPVNAQAKSLPVVVDFLSGVWGDASKQIACQTAASANMVSLYVTWHGMATGHPANWYVKNRKWYKPLKDIDKPGKWLLHDMYVRVMRTFDFAKSIPEWNGKELIVRGGSGGGLQAIAAAGLVPEITTALVGVPSGCEMNAHRMGRWPAYVLRSCPEVAKRPEVERAIAYYDCVNFAPDIKCEIFVSTGFTDEMCMPSAVIAFYNNLPADTRKHLTTDPRGGHYGLTKDRAAAERFSKLSTITVHSVNPV